MEREPTRKGIRRVAFEASLVARTAGHIIRESILHPNTTTIIDRNRTTGEIKITRETNKPK